MQLGAVERLVGVDVADPGDAGLGRAGRTSAAASGPRPCARSASGVSSAESGSTPTRGARYSSSSSAPSRSAVPKRRTSVNSSSRAVVERRARAQVRLGRGLVQARPPSAVRLHQSATRLIASGRRSSRLPVIRRCRPGSRRPRGAAAGTCRGDRPPRSARPVKPRLDQPPRRLGPRPALVEHLGVDAIARPGQLGRELAPDRLDLGQLGHRPQGYRRRCAQRSRAPRVGLEVDLLQLARPRGGCRAGWSRRRRGRASPGPSAGRSRRSAGGWRRCGAACAGSSARQAGRLGVAAGRSCRGPAGSAARRGS